MNKVSINAAQQRYVIECGEGYTCLGFANARDHANQIASKLSRANLAFTDEDYATLAGYDKYLKAIQAWSQSPLTRTTYFDPGTDAKAARVLESCRTHERKVRLILGVTSTGGVFHCCPPMFQHGWAFLLFRLFNSADNFSQDKNYQ